MTNNTYRIYTRSNENARTINTPMMGRTYYSIVTVEGKEAAQAKAAELRAAGVIISEIRAGFGGRRVWF